MQASSSNQINESSRTLWAGSLPPYVDEAYLHRLFLPTGELLNARVMRDRQTGLSQGFAFLVFTSQAAAQNVLNQYDGQQIPNTNHVLRLNWAAFGLGQGGDGTESHSLFVGDLALEVTDLTLQKTFQNFFASVNSAKVITERSTGRSKGYGFVRFTNAAERDKALQCMEGQYICSRPIRVSHATAKKYQGDGMFHPSDLDPSNTTAFVGNVNSDVTEEDISQVFRRCGDIVSIKLLRAKGCAFVTYAERSSAERAIVDLHGKVIKNCAIRLCWGRRSSQTRIQAPIAGIAPGFGLPAQQPQALPFYEGAYPRWPEQIYGRPSLGATGVLPLIPQPGIIDAALQAAGMPAPLAFSPDQDLGLGSQEPSGLPRFAGRAQSVPEALEALAQLSLSHQPPLSAPQDSSRALH